MRRLIDLSLWQLPRWGQYVCGLLLVALATISRHQSQSFFGDKGALVFFTFPIVITAFIGGFGPGIVAAFASLVIAKLLFIPPVGSFELTDQVMKVSILGMALNWLLICVICELLREAARSYSKATDERNQQRDQLTIILDGISDGFFAVDREWRITHANRSLRHILGQYASNLEGCVLWDFFPPEYEGVKRQLIASLETNEFLTMDMLERGGIRWLQLRAFPEEQGMFVYIQDITERKEAQHRNERILADERHARSEAEKASRLRDEFVATVSHELRTPLVSILGWSELLQGRNYDDAYILEGLAAIDRSSKQQAKLIEELLDISRMSAGKFQMNTEIVSLDDVVDEAMQGCRLAAQNKGIEIKSEMPPEGVLIQGDAGRLLQIVTNLISNAVKFTKKEGHVAVSLVRDGSTAILKVVDDGEGISSAFLPYVFDRFRQANATITRSHGGLGLGLTIVKQLVELHGGAIEAVSEGLGKGSTFIVTLPIAAVFSPEDIPHKDNPSNKHPEKLQPLAGYRVLVVDDDEGTRDLLGIILRESGAEVWLEEKAEAALSAFASFRPHILLSDIGMPGVDGYQFLMMVRSLPASKGGRVPAVALTAFSRDEDKQRAMEAGFQAHLGKPIESANLIQTLSQVAKNAEKAEELEASAQR